MEAAPRFPLGAVPRRAVSILRLHTAGFLVTSFLVVFVPSLLGDRVSDSIADALVPEPPEGDGDLAEILRALIAILPDVLCAFGTILLVALVVHAAVARTRGRTPDFAANLRAALRDYPRCAVAAIVIALCAAAASLLIVPSLLLTGLWSLALPAIVAERASLREAFGRSRTLTAGHRRAIVGWALPLALLWGAGKLLRHADAALDLGEIAVWTLRSIGAGLQMALALAASACLAATYLELCRAQPDAAGATTNTAGD